MQNKKPIIIIAVLGVLALGLGYWFGLSKKGSSGGGGGKEPEFLKQGLVAYYPFNGNAKDESGNGNDGTIKGPTLTVDRHGVKDGAYDFDGNQGILLPLTSQDTPKQNTLSGWIKIPNMNIHPTEGGDKIVFLLKFNLGVWWFPRGAKDDIYGIYALRDLDLDSFLSRPDPDVNFDPTKWNLLTGTYDGETMICYINGVKAGIYKPTEQELNPDVKPLRSAMIGNAIGGGRPVYCQIDDVRIYNRALTESEVKALYDLEKVN